MKFFTVTKKCVALALAIATVGFVGCSSGSSDDDSDDTYTENGGGVKF